MSDHHDTDLLNLGDEPEAGFLTDQDPHAADIGDPAIALEDEPASSAAVLVETEPDLSVLDTRPQPGPPRPYRFPAFERVVLDNGLTVIWCHTPGRALLAANLILLGGAALEPPGAAGVTVLCARGLTEGTQARDAIAFIEAAERLGAEVHADASWDALLATLEVPRSRFADALALLAEMAITPAFPEREVERLREERLNDLLQVRADPRRRAERAFAEQVYAPGSPYARPMAGTEETVAMLAREQVASRHAAALAGGGPTLVVAGDLAGVDVAEVAARRFAEWRIDASGAPAAPAADEHPAGRRVLLIDRPGAPQSEVRIGHVGTSRQTADFHAIAVLNAILGGTFDSRLNRLLREDRGYTYGISSSFEMRRAAGPFAVRTAVHSEVTLPAVRDALGVLRGICEAEVEQRELDTARDYLVGVFPLRFETPTQVCAAISGLVVQGLPDDELDRYRPAVAAVEAAAVLDAARRHIRVDDAAIVIVGDAASLEPQLREAEAELGPLTVERDEAPVDAAAGSAADAAELAAE